MPEIYLYAEVLTHIRQLTLYASLQTAKNEHTKILISSDKKVVTVLHDGETAGIYLPTQISGTANVTFPLERRTEISARVQIEDLDELSALTEEPTGIEAPWSATDLTTNTSLKCKACHEVLLDAGQIASWKDLPSENWAELMDFWFCHKPHENTIDPDHDHAAEAKGFSTTSKITAVSGTGFTDVVSFLLHSSNCKGLNVSQITLACAYYLPFYGRKKEADHSYKSILWVDISDTTATDEF